MNVIRILGGDRFVSQTHRCHMEQLQGQADKERCSRRQHLGLATLVGAGEQEALAGEHWLTFWDPDVGQTQDRTRQPQGLEHGLSQISDNRWHLQEITRGRHSRSKTGLMK